jgi:polysaccharide pyruvyl transferase WcaK-like protein
MVSPSGYWSLARRSDIVIDIGAGDSFSDIYGPKRLRWLFWLKALAHLAGTPLVMAPQTIGPFTKRWSRTLARWTMRKSALVASRDRLSTEEATNLGINNVIEASDLAMRLPYDPQLRVQTGSVRVGINVSALLMGGGYTKNNSFGLQSNYPELVRDLIRFFQNEGCEVHLVPHVVPLSEMDGGYSEDDANANSALAEEFPEVILAPHFATPSEAKTYISGLDFFMGARMHACIAAFSSGVPVVPMAYSRKFEGLFGSLGYHRTVDCTKQSRDEIFALIKMAFFKREDLAAEVRQSATHSAERVDRYTRALTEIMQEL